MNDFINLYLEFTNDYLTIEIFAEHKCISVELASLIIKEGRILHHVNTGAIENLSDSSKKHAIEKMGL